MTANSIQLNCFCEHKQLENFLIGYDNVLVLTGQRKPIKNRLVPERTNRLFNLCVYRGPIQLRTEPRLNTLDQLKLGQIMPLPSSGS
jgi:hypothetical protein